jgi:hypothetical protein
MQFAGSTRMHISFAAEGAAQDDKQWA